MENTVLLVKQPLGTSSEFLSIQKKIRLAYNLCAAWQTELQSNSYVHGLLEKLARSIENTRKVMGEIGLLAICKHCDEDEGGSCCGRGMENKYDAVLLLINLLLGVSLPEQRSETNSCYFLKKNGCKLIARHVLCVNYICSRIERNVATVEIIKLQHIAGDEIGLLFTLHQTIKKFINNNTNDQRFLK